MEEEKWGVKRICPETNKRFYDLGKDPIVSPYTGKEYEASYFDLDDKAKTLMGDKEDKDAIKLATEAELAEDETDDVIIDDDILEEDEDEDTVPLDEIKEYVAGDDEE